MTDPYAGLAYGRSGEGDWVDRVSVAGWFSACSSYASDRAANAANKGIISRAGSRVIARVMKTDEELMIARHAATLLGKRTLTPAA